MLCAACNHQILPLKLNAKARAITVDYCSHCGSVWTDHGDVNFLELKDVANMDYYMPKEPYYVMPDVLHCPNDRTQLELFRGESVPVDLRIYTCPKCRGYFFPFKNMTAFKRAQYAKVEYYKTWNIPLPSVYAVVLPVLAFLMIGGVAVSLYQVTRQQDIRTSARDMFSPPLVTFPNPGEAFINFTTQQPTVTKIRYWNIETEKYELPVSFELQSSHTITLRDLLPNTTYTYELITTQPKEITSERYSFTTGR